MTEPAPRKSDLGVRTASAVVMIAVSGAAFWLGGWAWILFVGVVAAVVLWEWRALVRGFAVGSLNVTVWNLGGVIYIGFAAAVLLALRGRNGEIILLQLVGAVIATDVGAYFAGRTLGGPKIAPTISPSKTWAGLIGGMAAAGAMVWTLAYLLNSEGIGTGVDYALMGALFAVFAQIGDFFESWMKRRAGVKDSGKLIPGHGGLLDRIDGLLAVVVAYAMFGLVIIGAGSL